MSFDTLIAASQRLNASVEALAALGAETFASGTPILLVVGKRP